jgi:hypothetical protein
MAPIARLTHTMSASTITPVRKSNNAEYTSVIVGHGSSAVTIQTLVAPSIHAFIPDKAMAFDFLFTQLRAFHPSINVTDLTTALSNHFDVNHSVARSETAAVLALLHSALFRCENLSGIRFLDRVGVPIGTIDEDPADRQGDIAFFVFDTTISAGDVDRRLAAIEPFTIRFSLPLPQHVRGTGTDLPPTSPLTMSPPHQLTAAGPDFQSLEAKLEAAIADSLEQEGEESPRSRARLTALQAELRAIVDQTPTPKRLFQSAGSPGTFTSLSPKMARILTSSDPGSLPTYLGSLNFLDDQDTFDSVFPAPLPLDEDGQPCDRTCSTSVSSRIKDFLGRCELDLFADILRLDYVGSDSATSPETIRQISDRLSRLSIVYQSRGQTHTCRVDDLFKKYLSEVPVLPDDTRLWGFTLTNYFWSALPEEMQSRITENRMYKPPDMSTLVTKTIQLNELRKLREAAVQASKDISDHDVKLARMIAEGLRKHQPYHHRPASPAPPTATVHAAMTSAAETVMTQYSTPPPLATFQPLALPPAPTNHYGPAAATTANPVSGPVVDPYTGYVSPHDRNFRGCLGCGDDAHQYKDCPSNKTEPTHSLFTKNYLARYPEKRKYPPRPEEVTALVAASLPSAAPVAGPSILRNPASSGGIGRGAGAVLPAWMTRGNGPTPPDAGSTKKVRLFTVFVKIFQQSATTGPRLAPFPIRINNLMPAITVNLGHSLDAAVSLVCLYDTCAAVCSGNLLFHQWVITTYPDLVHSFEQFDDANPFEPIKLVGAITNPADFDAAAHGQLTAVVRYHLPYTIVPSGESPVLCIALGADVAVNTILGWPVIEDLEIELRIRKEMFYSTTLCTPFTLTREAAPLGLPDGVDFDPARDFRRPDATPPDPSDRSGRSPSPSPSTGPIVSFPMEFDPSRQMKELCMQLNATQAAQAAALVARAPSTTTAMHALASADPPSPAASPVDTVIEGPPWDASPFPGPS